MQTAHLALEQLPTFKIDNFSAHRHRHFQCVVVDGAVFHRVFDLRAFYATLGYTKDIANQWIAPDEYIWEIFTRAGAPRSRTCLQRLIVHYLRQHSPEFTARYGTVVEPLVGKCTPQAVATAKFCTECFMHPNQGI